MQIHALQLLPLAASAASAACVARHHAAPAPAAVAAPASPAAPAAPAAVVGNQGQQQQQAVASPAAQAKQVSAAAGTTGTSTFYGGNLQGGTCSFSTYSLPSGIYGTAFSGSAWNNGAKCGSCLEVTAKGKTIKVMVVDQCPECEPGHLDLFENAWKALSPSSSDPMTTSWTEVPCGITSPLVLHNKSGTSSHWFSMQVVNANEAVAKLEVSTDGGKTWQGTKRQPYNFFENSSGFGADKQTVRVTSASGKTVTVQNVGVESDSQIKAASNF
ncbi:RlpA-like double-psi beta-barrel-protein domain-containing protein-containing protein [Apiospora rasikravindrae]|uniref:RlpA-like double-psi beta-barrel-protein domain-containing protein-containing protein n=1 Tax=Apiospora rasikravindrae TaxID=990691 RepID=A0ABR1T0I0_9PEZI